jgi:hypothetical protein
MAAPDVACGFNVIATGLLAQHWTGRQRQDIYTGLVAAVAAGSPRRAVTGLDLDTVLAEGLPGVPAPGEYAYGDRVPEQQPGFTPDPVLVTARCRAALTEQAGSVAGHFISLYEVGEVIDPAHADALLPGEVILIVHTGAPALRAQIDRTHTVPMAARCLDEDYLPPELIEAGLFGVPVSDPLAAEFLTLTACAVNYGFANRHIVAERILALLARHAARSQRIADARLIRHVGHCAYHPGTQTGGTAAVVTSRGIQPTAWTGDAAGLPGQPMTFITGSDLTHAYLVTAGPRASEYGWRCGHGTPQWVTAAPPPHLDDPAWISPGLMLARAPCANTTPDHARIRSDMINLEATIAAMRASGMATPAARLLPLMNYQEHRHA